MVKSLKSQKIHESVLVNEVLEAFELFRPLKKVTKKKIIDATVGTGGHTLGLVNYGADVLGIDVNSEMLAVAEERLKKALRAKDPSGPVAYLGSFGLVSGNFKDIDKLAKDNGFEEVDGILFDLGVTNVVLKSENLGFSFSNPDAELDMRMDPKNQAVKGSDLINILREDQLVELFSKILKRAEAEKIAYEIVSFRKTRKIETVGDFLEAIKFVKGKPSLHLGTLPFLALRIAVNSELENLKEALPKAFDVLKSGGRIVTISFHSGEDAIVKKFFEESQRAGLAKTDNKKPIIASAEELRTNSKARSAKLRILEKI